MKPNEIREELKARGMTIRDLAEATGILENYLTKSLSVTAAKPRRFKVEEMKAIESYFAVPKQDGLRIEKIIESPKIKHLGKVAQGVWLEESAFDPDRDEYVEYDRSDGDPGTDNLFAVTPEGLSMNLEWKLETRLICRFIPFSHYSWKEEDRVIVARQAHDLREMTCKIIRYDSDGVAWLHSNSDQPQFQEPWRLGKPDEDLHVDDEITVIGKVIRAVTIYE